MKIIPASPLWGQTLLPGYCGFITREHDIVGDGIAWFERFETGLPFVHTFVIESGGASVPASRPPLRTCPSPAGAGEGGRRPGEGFKGSTEYCGEGGPINSATRIIEAHATTGVSRASLDEYIGGPTVDGAAIANRCQCFIRIPLGYTEKIGETIVAGAASHLGEKYGFGTIVADALANTWLGHGLDFLTRDRWDRLICFLLTNRHKQICSQLVARALQSQLYLRLRGCLRRPADTILPRELGNDPAIWDPVIYQLKIQN